MHHEPETPPVLDQSFPTDPTGLPEAAAPQILELADGDTVDLRVAPVAKRLGDSTVRMLGYNGSIPGPTLRVQQGSEVIVNVTNDGDLDTTVHWHGLRLENKDDGVPHETQQPIPIGGSFTYRIQFPDPGLYWYHPHIREDYTQEMGLYGNIIVKPSEPAAGAGAGAHRRRAIRGDHGHVDHRRCLRGVVRHHGVSSRAPLTEFLPDPRFIRTSQPSGEKNSMSQVTRKPSQPATEGIPGKRFRPFRRTRKVIGAIALTALGITLASTAANAVLEQQERSSTAQYGHLVEVAGGALNVVRAGTKGGQPLVLLSGFSTVAPALDFSPLIRELDAYDVIVVEGFGYGYSDMSARERTVENISTELHEALSSLDIKEPYVLAGHSLGGLYTLDYAKRYPSEVSAVIGIDSTVPTAQFEKEAAANGGGINITGILSTIGFVRTVVWVAPSVVDPKSDDYTPSEVERMRQMTSWNFGNAAVADEAAHMASNAAALREVTYPENLPVLHFLASDNVALTPDWLDSHKDQLQNVSRHEIVELEGQHYLHWTQSKAMADKITQFLQESVPS